MFDNDWMVAIPCYNSLHVASRHKFCNQWKDLDIPKEESCNWFDVSWLESMKDTRANEVCHYYNGQNQSGKGLKTLYYNIPNIYLPITKCLNGHYL